MSKQIDVILFDSRFPAFRFYGAEGLYPVEGVLATIEVKSNLTKSETEIALDNSKSVLDLRGYSNSNGGIVDRAKELVLKDGCSVDDAKRKTGYELFPATYVFAFGGLKTSHKLRDAINGWWKDRNSPTFFGGSCECLPRIVAGRNVMAILSDDILTPAPDHPTNEDLLMVVSPTESAFGLFACHVLDTVMKRLDAKHGVFGHSFDLGRYLPFKQYATRLQGKQGAFIYR